MMYQTASDRSITAGVAVVQGLVRASDGHTAWALPGGGITMSRKRAEFVAKRMNLYMQERGYDAA